LISALLPPLPPPPLRIVFLGTPALAATVLEALLEGPDRVVGVFARPDAASGRGLKSNAPPVVELARSRSIEVHQPRGWKDGAATATLAALAPDLVVVAAYGRLLPQAALDCPRFGCINVHASLLPRWRGADPITRAILEGDEETGVTIMQMVLEMDAGPMLHQRTLAIRPDDTGESLERRLASLGGEALGEALVKWRAGRLEARGQEPAEITFAPPLRKEHGRIDWQEPAIRIERAIRGLQPWPGAVTERSGQALKIWTAETSPATGDPVPPGTVLALDREGPRIQTGRDGLRLLEVQAAGKRRMSAAEWARGARLQVGERLGS
jgi:methionyl-tRNA formyltransferase